MADEASERVPAEPEPLDAASERVSPAAQRRLLQLAQAGYLARLTQPVWPGTGGENKKRPPFPGGRYDNSSGHRLGAAPPLKVRKRSHRG